MSEPRQKKIDLTREETERFIGFYLSQECLWNVQHATYSKRDNRLAAQSMIAEQMYCHGREMTVEQVAAKIASLRTYYGRELRKITQSEKSGAGVDDLYHSSWEFFTVLDPFLRCHVQQRPSTNNLMREPISAAPITITDDNECTGSIECTMDSTDNGCSQETSHCSGYAESMPVQKPDKAKPHPKKRRNQATGSPELKNLMYRTLERISQKKAKSDTNDCDILFGQQVGLELKKLKT
ncbi:uncharacterized protein LOC124265187 [Haliotis rubra]|uniref:uncharacterized protein LOC124265187 n=1 Tax=Haliotis rubra TaxID=36100 RepID=UPI001EE57406|nr:uncharacterized protein LOC124265187 [Haliotis rubra]